MSTWDDKPNDYEHALAEIERLRAALEAETEECARTAEEAPLGTMPIDIARAIRARKDKPMVV